MSFDSAFEKAVATFGSQTELAEALGITRGRVNQWRSVPIPVEHCLEIEKRSRAIASRRRQAALIVTCEELRPDLDWAVVRCNRVPRPRRSEPAHS
jgi:DNA-binding transcriptional regulator YdaS (Cro superfamily)